MNPAEKYGNTLPGVHPLIRERWSPRSFADRDVSSEDLKIIMDAAHWAASSANEQPWRFLVARKTDGAAYQQVLGLLVPSNQVWAKSAPVLMITAAKRTFTQSDQPNRYAMHDTGAALAFLFLQATALGLHAHGMGGFDIERARTELAIPEGFEVGAAVALGYLGSPDELPDNLRKRELAKRERKPLSEIVFGTHWGEPLDF